jgi:hypothetical protein
VKPLSQQNLYEVLEVPFDATQPVIAEAVERAMALYAPGSLATYTLMDPEEERLLARLLEEARSTLLDPAARARYDELITGPDQPGARERAAPQPPQEMDPVIRAAWPELPPVIPAVGQPPEEEWEDEVAEPEPPREQAATATAVEIAPPAPQPQVGGRRADAPPPVEPRAAPILLERVVERAAAEPSAPAPALAAPAPVAAPPAAAPAVAAAAPAVELVPDDGTWSGEVLRRIRESRGLSVQQVSERTKVTRHHVENVEGDRFEQLPATVYLRGILLSIARELRLDGQKVARSYLDRAAAARAARPARPGGAGQRGH